MSKKQPDGMDEDRPPIGVIDYLSRPGGAEAELYVTLRAGYKKWRDKLSTAASGGCSFEIIDVFNSVTDSFVRDTDTMHNRINDAAGSLLGGERTLNKIMNDAMIGMKNACSAVKNCKDEADVISILADQVDMAHYGLHCTFSHAHKSAAERGAIVGRFQS